MASVSCAGCGSHVESVPKMKPKKWCSDYCRIKTYYERHPDKKALRHQRHLELERRKAAARRKNCLLCGKPKRTNRGDYCSRTKECQRAGRMATTPCATYGCGRASQGRGLCSTHYQQWWREQAKNRDTYRTRRSRENAARKLAVAAATLEKVSPAKVFEADGWRCHLCGKKIDRKLKRPDPMSATIDHVLPLSKGGLHEYANCRAAHYSCNSAKSNRGGGEQMLLLAVS